jgi:hypothetical protein
MHESLIPNPDHLVLKISDEFSRFPEVSAVALGGSLGSGYGSHDSDIDIYVYLTNGQTLLPIQRRQLIENRRAGRSEVNNQFWETGDEWQEPSGLFVDVMYRSKIWMEEQLDRVLVQHMASTGYTTCFWYNVLHSKLLYDSEGWFAAVQEQVKVPYPEPLRKAIIEKNYPLLRDTISSYKNQIHKAFTRNDIVSINHRIAGFLASYFDILFAINRLPHPGEKRLVELVKRDCPIIPVNIEEVNIIIQSCAVLNGSIEKHVDSLVDGLDDILF